MENALRWAADNWAAIAVGLSLVIQITPIKVNPWSSLFKWVGKMVTADLNKKVDEINTSVLKLQNNIDENEKDRIRWEVLDFANSCRNGRRHTKDEFQHIIVLHDKYRIMLERTHDTNGVFDAEYEYVKKLYAERQEKNDFL